MNATPQHNGTEKSDASDRTLLRRLQGGEQDAATALYVRYAKRLQQLAQSQTSRDLSVRLDPEDVVQSVFRTFFRRARAGDYEIPEGEELWKLFLVISLNKVRALGAFHRAGKRDIRATTPLKGTELIADTVDGQDETAFQILRMTIDEELQDLPPQHREMVLLRIEGHEVATIAERTQRSKRSVERVLQSFRKRLADILQDNTLRGTHGE